MTKAVGYIRASTQGQRCLYGERCRVGKTVKDFQKAVKLPGIRLMVQTKQLGRDGGVGVSNEAIQDAVTNPEQVIEQPPTKPNQGPTYKYVGKNAIVVLNQAGEVVTTWATGSQGLRSGK